MDIFTEHYISSISRRRVRLISYIVVTIPLAAFAIGCAASGALPSSTPTSKAPLTIGTILSSPLTYEGQIVTLTTEYRGWESGYGSPPVTRSDWLIKDSSGVIYVTGRAPEGLDPLTSRGTAVSVTGTVRLNDGKPYLEKR